MKIDGNQKYAYIVVLLIILAGLFLFSRSSQAPDKAGDVVNEVEKTEEENTPATDEKKPEVSTSKMTPEQYKELINKGHKLYLEGDYAGALGYFKQALAFGESDRIYRSIYSAYLELKDYQNAEIAIKKSVTFNSKIPNNWLEYASFEHNYMKAPFEVVSKIYLDALKATKNNVDVITSYSGYLVENKKYAEAITYLEKAIVANPARKATFEAEIAHLRTLQ